MKISVNCFSGSLDISQRTPFHEQDSEPIFIPGTRLTQECMSCVRALCVAAFGDSALVGLRAWYACAMGLHVLKPSKKHGLKKVKSKRRSPPSTWGDNRRFRQSVQKLHPLQAKLFLSLILTLYIVNYTRTQTTHQTLRGS